jgi:hypothetical protein
MKNKSKMVRRLKFHILFLYSIVVVVVGCDGGETNPAKYPAAWDGSTKIPAWDCSNLDHAKVYVIGTFQEAAGYLDVLFDPEKPSNFCTGFARYHAPGVVSVSGKYYYSGIEETTGNAVFTYNPDKLEIDAVAGDEYILYSNNGDIWNYPENSFENDDYLISNGIACGIRYVFLQPNTDFKFYTCPNDTLHAEDLREPLNLGNGEVISITPDGLAVVAQYSELSIYDMQGNSRKLDLPIVGPAIRVTFLAAKNFIDTSTMRNKMWLAVNVGNSDSSDPIHRQWLLDLSDEMIVDQGAYAGLPDTMKDNGVGSSKLDNHGNLWQIGSVVQGKYSFVEVIVKRTLKNSSVVFYEGDYDGKYSDEYASLPPIYLHASSIIGGM